MNSTSSNPTRKKKTNHSHPTTNHDTTRGTMSSPAMFRLLSDLKQIKTEPPEGVSAAPLSEDNMFVWGATIFGPADCPWEGGVFTLRLTFSDKYPDKPPKVKFTCEMFHPNVFTDGNLCLDIIQDKWSPIYSVSSILTSIQSLLTDPNCSSPANPTASQMYLTDRAAYNKKIRRIAEKSLENAA